VASDILVGDPGPIHPLGEFGLTDQVRLEGPEVILVPSKGVGGRPAFFLQVTDKGCNEIGRAVLLSIPVPGNVDGNGIDGASIRIRRINFPSEYGPTAHIQP